MQTTLLGLAIALILALLAALVGPYFVNWSDHRAYFEAEASRLVGLQVRVAGPIQVSMLPTPSMTLGDIEIGPAGQISRLRARSLSIELGLGPLMRGEIRAVETRLVGPQFGIGLNSLGHVDWPAMAAQTEQVAIERLNIEDGRIVLTDGASNSRLVLDKLWFRGQVRSLSGPFRGEGAFVSAGEIYGYRVSAGRLLDDAMKFKLNVDIAERPLAIEFDGTVTADRRAPKFEGALSLSRPVGATRAAGRTIVREPWKLTSKLKANAQSALLEQIEFQYGPEERAAKLDGAAEVKFGERPRLQGALSARQIDLDKLIATAETPRRLPAPATQAVADLLSGMMRPAMPVSLTVSIDAVTLGGAALQGFGGDMRSDGAAWRLDRLEFRAPGFSKVAISGLLDPTSRSLGFAGSVSVDANDPKSLIAWLAGQQASVAQVLVKPWMLRGDVTLAPDRIAVDQLRSEFDRGVIEGRLAYVWPAAGRPARVDADLKAGDIDFDALLGFAEGAFSGLGLEAPRDIALALEIGRARIAGFEARNAAARLNIDPDGVLVERLSVADFGNASVVASGRIQTMATPGGSIALDVDARELNAVMALADKFAPQIAGPLRRLAGTERTAKLRATVSLENAPSGAAANLAVAGRIGATRLDVTAGATGKPEHFVVTDLAALAAADMRFEGRFEADDGAKLLGIAGLERVAALDRTAAARAPARFHVVATGPLNRELRFESNLASGAFDLSGNGTLRLPADQPAGVSIDRLTGSIAGSKVQGRLAFRLGDEPRIDGAIEADALDAPAIVASAIGMRIAAPGSAWTTEPFATSASVLAGRIEFRTERAQLSRTLQARPLRGVARFGASQLVFEDIDAQLAGGRLTGRLAFADGAGGLTARAQVALNAADAAAAIAAEGRPPVTGRLTLRAEMEGSGRSPAAFIGSLAGAGTVALENGQLAGLNPRVFDALIRAVDLGIPTDANRIRDFVTTALETGTLPASRAEAAIAIQAGQARLSHVVSQTSGADLSMSANIDLADATIDAAVTLTGTQTQGNGLRPTIAVALKGPLMTPARSVDASALASWLALRSVEQQAKQIDAMERQQREQREREQREMAAPPAKPAPALAGETVPPGETTSGLPDAGAVPPLPPAINVLPVPRPRGTPRAEAPAAARPATPKPANAPLDLLGSQN